MSFKNIFNSQTFQLIKKNDNFLNAFSSMFDFSPVDTKFKCEKTDEEADFKALESDWKAVGVDIKETFKQIHV